MCTYYPPCKSSSNNIKVELDLSNYATKNDLKNITHLDVSSFASKTNLSNCNGIRTHNHLIRKRTLSVWLNG